MLIKYLEKEQFLLKNTLKHHIDELCARDNPQGILLCQKHKGSFRWKRRYLQNGLPVTVPLRKSEKELAEKLAVNLYRLVCILYLQKRLSRLGNMVRQFRRGPGHGSSESGKAGIGVSPGGGRGPGAESDQYEPDDFLTGNPLFRILDRLRNLPESPADFFRASSPYRPLLLSYLSNQYSALIDWYLGAFCQNSEHPEHLQFPVKLGYKVRSKSEMMTADRLCEEGILFHYEEQILLGNKEVFPDFYIPITFSEKYAWEHNGAMDNDSYFYRARGKILGYMDNHWYPGINMISTYETRNHPLTEERIDQQIHWLKTRYRIAFPDLPPDESINMYDLANYARISRVEK